MSEMYHSIIFNRNDFLVIHFQKSISIKLVDRNYKIV